MRGRCRRSGRGLRRSRSRSSMRRRWAAGLARRRGVGASFWGRRLLRRWWRRRWGCRLPHAALAPSGQPIWLDAATRSARALLRMTAVGIGTKDVLTDAAVRNAMVLHAAFGGSTNLLLHVPAIAHAAGLRRPTVSDWTAINRAVPRLVDALPNGPGNFATVQVFLAGGGAGGDAASAGGGAAGYCGDDGDGRDAGCEPGLVGAE